MNNWDKVIKSLLSVSISKSLVELCNSFEIRNTSSIMVLLIKEVCTKIIKSAGIPGTDSGLGGGGGGVHGGISYKNIEYWCIHYKILNMHHTYMEYTSQILNKLYKIIEYSNFIANIGSHYKISTVKFCWSLETSYRIIWNQKDWYTFLALALYAQMSDL